MILPQTQEAKLRRLWKLDFGKKLIPPLESFEDIRLAPLQQEDAREDPVTSTKAREFSAIDPTAEGRTSNMYSLALEVCDFKQCDFIHFVRDAFSKCMQLSYVVTNKDRKLLIL